MVKRRGPMSASELAAELEQDADYQARRKARDAELAAAVEERRAAREPVMVDLRAAGVEVSDTYDLRTRSDEVRGRLAAAMGGCARRAHYEDLLGFVRDEDLGSSRIHFLRPINRIGNRMEPGRGRAVIEGLAGDPVLGNEATAILKGRSRSQ